MGMKPRITLLTKTASTMVVYVPKPKNNLVSMLKMLANVHNGRGDTKSILTNDCYFA